MSGIIKGISGHTVMIECDTLDGFQIDDIVDIKKHRKQRSLSANAYFHVLVGKLSEALKLPFAEVKNTLITSYGQIEYIDEVPAIIKTNVPNDIMAQNELLHAKPIYVEDTDAFWYRLYRGTHTYNSAEMAKLIDATVEECKSQGIETMTPEELMRLTNYEKQGYTV